MANMVKQNHESFAAIIGEDNIRAVFKSSRVSGL